MKLYLIWLVLLMLAACTTTVPLKEGKSDNNGTYHVDYLFEHDGCKVYRFYDRGSYVYFTNCNGETIVKGDSMSVRNTVRRTNGQ